MMIQQRLDKRYLTFGLVAAVLALLLVQARPAAAEAARVDHGGNFVPSAPTHSHGAIGVYPATVTTGNNANAMTATTAVFAGRPHLTALVAVGGNGLTLFYQDAMPGRSFPVEIYRSTNLSVDGDDTYVTTVTVTPQAATGAQGFVVGIHIPASFDVSGEFFLLAAGPTAGNAVPLEGVLFLPGYPLSIWGDAAAADSLTTSGTTTIVVNFNGAAYSYTAGDVREIRFRAFGGNDVLDHQANKVLIAWGGDGDDSLAGGPTSDKLFAGAGSDTVSGGAGNDLLNGGSGADFLYGGADDDRLFAGGGCARGDNALDVLDGGSGTDTGYHVLRPPGDTRISIEITSC
jgi:Ca2+-binding RTX toxin-like protein